MSTVSTVGIDLAKNVSSVHGVDARGVVLIRRVWSQREIDGTEICGPISQAREARRQ
jgi:hypothetical protein